MTTTPNLTKHNIYQNARLGTSGTWCCTVNIPLKFHPFIYFVFKLYSKIVCSNVGSYKYLYVYLLCTVYLLCAGFCIASATIKTCCCRSVH